MVKRAGWQKERERSRGRVTGGNRRERERNGCKMAEGQKSPEKTGQGEKPALELYIHIPFCVRKCAYCDFLSFPASEEVQERYCAALLEELAAGSLRCRNYRVVSVFIGGGTPSVVSPRLIRSLLEAIRLSYDCDPGAEISMEINPGTVDAGKLSVYRACGINRLSIGLQSARDEELRMLGRIHTFRQFCEAYELARKAGFSNLNVDLMSALPGQTVESYEETLRAVLSLNPVPEHISAYSLIVEEGTPFFRLQEEGRLPLPDEEQERQMYERTGILLREAGYERYEISNYARPGCQCRHNIGYWKRVPYLGFGIGAASLFEEERFSNTRTLSQYLENPLEARREVQRLSVQEQMEEFMFLGLRLTAGVLEDDFFHKFHRPLMEVYGETVRKNQADGLLVHRDGRLFLTGRGVDVSNYVFAQFLF